jgi:PKD repeat protein
MTIGGLRTYSGQEAIDYLGERLGRIAELHGVSEEFLKQQFLIDATIRVDEKGQIFFVEKASPTTEPNDPNEYLYFTYSGNPYILHSKPGASKVIYLDTNGQHVENTVWNGPPIDAPPWSPDPTDIYKLWSSVAEDYRIFDVDVTTEEPTLDKLHRSSAEDSEYGMRVVITGYPPNNICSACGGIARLYSFSDVSPDGSSQPAWVFSGMLSDAHSVAEAASHEIGHTFGLFHDGKVAMNGSPSEEYYQGGGIWGAIMGASYNSWIGQWSKGEYAGASNQQDDIAIIESQLGRRFDDYVDTPDGALSFDTDTMYQDKSVIKPIEGVIETSSDVDLFEFTSGGGLATFVIDPNLIPGYKLDLGYGTYTVIRGVLGNLVPKVTIYDESMNEVALQSNNLANQRFPFAATVSANLPVGKFFLGVSSASTYDFSSYDSLGHYKITGSYVSTTKADPPVANISSSVAEGYGPLIVNFQSSNSIAGYGNISRLWTFGDDSSQSSDTSPTHIFKKTGIFTVRLIVTNDAQYTSMSEVQINVVSSLTNVARVKSLKLRLKKKNDLGSTYATITLVNERKKALKKANVCGRFGGSFVDTLVSSSSINNTQVCGKTSTSGVLKLLPPWKVSGGIGTITFTVETVTNLNPNLVFYRTGSKLISSSFTK